MNMSYCRYSNTLADLKDCYYVIEHVKGLSNEEKRAREKLIQLCCEIASDKDYLLSIDNEEIEV